MSGNRQIKFEVYAMQGGRWNIHTHFDADDRDEAINEAVRVERESGVTASCVMRANYNPISNESTDTVIYHSPSLNGRPTTASLSRGGDGSAHGTVLSPSGGPMAPAGSAAANAAADYERRDKEFQAKLRSEASGRTFGTGGQNMGGIPEFLNPYEEEETSVDLMRMSMAFLISSMVATAAAAALFFALRAVDLNIGRTPFVSTLAVVFGMTFLFMFIPMVKKIVQEGRGQRRSAEDATLPVHKYIPPADEYEAEASYTEEPEAQELPEQQEIPDLQESDENEEADFELIGEVVPLEELTAEIDLLLQAEKDALNAAQEDENENLETVPDEALEEIVVTVETPILIASNMDEELAGLLGLLASEATEKFGTSLTGDAYTRFGVILFLAGATEMIAREYGMIKKEYIAVLVNSVTKIGAEPAHARGFCANIDEYLLDERYLGMYDAGRNAGKAKLKSATAQSGIVEWIEYWKNPAVQSAKTEAVEQDGVPEGKRFVAVLFTDIVDSTTQQQAMGDEWMMQVVRVHNKTVRKALKKHSGREVKHMGDGIMASFAAVTEAVAASIAMQHGFAENRATTPDYPFTVRIGISAGEPIHESGDIFGTPVNLAARVLNKAGASEIAVSSVVKDMCDGKSFGFSEIGKVKLKGFNDPQMIFHVNLD